MSIHIGAKQGSIAETVLLPGDPLRAKYIAETYLSNVECYNEIRNMLGYTGTYKGKRLSVQGTGMGIPSFSIYATELIKEYQVKTLVRVGTSAPCKRGRNRRRCIGSSRIDRFITYTKYIRSCDRFCSDGRLYLTLHGI